MSKIGHFLRADGNYDVDVVSVETGLECDPELGLTQQQFKEECDINEIVRRFGLTGEIPGDFKMPVSGDFSEAVDFQTAMNMVTSSQAEFMRLPGEIRDRFANDPQRLIRFLEDVGNREEAMKLGLVQRPPERTRDVVQAVDELAAKIAGGTASEASRKIS